ncbi:MAG TPA: hypothetical protein VGL82_01385 [Bryobacteraceae bacterium]
MKSLILALALCFALSPLEGATFHSANMHLVKARKNKSKTRGRKPPKRRGQSRSRVN